MITKEDFLQFFKDKEKSGGNVSQAETWRIAGLKSAEFAGEHIAIAEDRAQKAMLLAKQMEASMKMQADALHAAYSAVFVEKSLRISELEAEIAILKRPKDGRDL